MVADHARFIVCDGGFSSAHEEATVFRHGSRGVSLPNCKG